MGVESNLRTSGVKENFDCLTQKKKKNQENLCFAKRSAINKLDLQFVECPMVIEHFGYIYIHIFFNMPHSPP